MNTVDCILAFYKIIGLPVLLGLAWISTLTIKNLKGIIEEFGSDNEGKSKATLKVIQNCFVYLCLCLLVIIGIYELVSKEILLALFISSFIFLGVKLVNDLKG